MTDFSQAETTQEEPAIAVGSDPVIVDKFEIIPDPIAPPSVTDPEPAGPASVKILIYDSTRPQIVTLETTDDSGTYRLEHEFGPLAGKDELLIKLDNERTLELEQKGKTMDVIPTAAAALMRLWRDLVQSVSGYGPEDEAIPANWKELVDVDDQLAAINTLLTAEIVEDEEELPEGSQILETVVRRKAWATSSGSTRSHLLRVVYAGHEIDTTHSLRAKTAEDVMIYDRIRGGMRLAKKSVQIRPQMKTKAGLYDRMVVETTGYAPGTPVPLHHKAAVITAHFETSSTVKKLSN